MTLLFLCTPWSSTTSRNSLIGFHWASNIHGIIRTAINLLPVHTEPGHKVSALLFHISFFVSLAFIDLATTKRMEFSQTHAETVGLDVSFRKSCLDAENGYPLTEINALHCVGINSSGTKNKYT
jgi:hypothetical protein